MKKDNGKYMMRNGLLILLLIFLLTGCMLNILKEEQTSTNISQNTSSAESSISDSCSSESDKFNYLVDSLQVVIDELQYQIDLLTQELELANSRVAINQEFCIPESLEFAGTMIDLKNERIAAKFKEIFDIELKNAPRYIPRSGYYFPVFDSLLKKYDIPSDVKYLAVAESELNSMASSHVGAVGVWQFMKSTAKGYNLKIDSFVDERRNIFKATDAAYKYLKNSYTQLSERKKSQDWLLAMCSYNAGLGSIYKIIDAQGGRTFRDLIMRVDETNRYVWRAMAIKLIFMSEEEIFGKKFSREASLFEMTKTVAIKLDGYHKIDDWAQAQGTVVSKVWELNPWIKIYQTERRKYSSVNDVVLPPGEFEILLPYNSVSDENALLVINQKLLEKNNGFFNYHTVKYGDTLYGIARKYHTTVAKIQKLNNLTSTTIRPGQKLKLLGNENFSASSSISNYHGDNVYTVKKGDSVSKIADRLNVSTKNLISLNNLKTKTINGQKIVIIYPGQKLSY